MDSAQTRGMGARKPSDGAVPLVKHETVVSSLPSNEARWGARVSCQPYCSGYVSIARRSADRRGRDSGQGFVPVPMGEQHATGRIRFESLKT